MHSRGGQGEAGDSSMGIGRTQTVVAVVLAAVALGSGLLGRAVLPEADAWEMAAGTAVMVAASPVVLVARRRPATVVVAIASVGLVLVAADTVWRELARLGGFVWMPVTLALGAALLATWGRRPGQFALGGAALVVYLGSTTVLTTPEGGWDLFFALGLLSPVTGGLVAGLVPRLLADRRERLRQAQRERELLAERARVAERRHLAAEMHDAVSHQISLLVLQAGALSATTCDPQTRAAADEIRAAGSKAIAEVRRIVGVLHEERTSAPSAHPSPALPASGPPAAEPAPDPASLVAEARAAGYSVKLTVTGERDGVAPHTARTVYRIVQEALTNARKHAPGAAVEVVLGYGEDAVTVDVTNDAPVGEPDPVLSTGGGTGLDGLRHRVDLLGGTVHAAPAAHGGFQVGALLPLTTKEQAQP